MQRPRARVRKTGRQSLSLRIAPAAAMRRFDELVLRFRRSVYRFCWRLLRSPDAEDLAQDTFVRAFVHFERFDPERPVLPWLIAIARRLCLDVLRRRKVMARVETLPVTGPSARSPEGEASLREQLSRSSELSMIWTRAREWPSSSSTSRRCRTETSRLPSRCRWAR